MGKGFLVKQSWVLAVGAWMATAGLGAQTLPVVNNRPEPVEGLPRMAHVVVVIEENHSLDDLIVKEKKTCPYMNQLARSGALLTQSYAVSHPSLPNYLALFSGSTQGVTDDGCEDAFSGPQLASELVKAGLTFRAYSEALPSPGSTECHGQDKNGYYKKHCPWAYWQGSGAFPADLNRPFSEFPKGHYDSLPTIAFVIPDEAHDMHEPNGYPPAADKWLKRNLEGYRRWAARHNSLLIVTWDEDDYSQDNQIPTIFCGARVRTGKCAEKTDHYGILRTLEDMYGLKPLGESARAFPVTSVFR